MRSKAIDQATLSIIHKGSKGKGLTKSEALTLLHELPTRGEAFTALLKTADGLSRRQFGNMGEVHGQIGLNGERCSNDCQFCMFSDTWSALDTPFCLNKKEVLEHAAALGAQNVGSISLMTTADYDFDLFLSMGAMVRKELKGRIPLFANWGDLDSDQARAVKKAGFTFCYHALRLGEGVVTLIDPYKRMQTIENAHRAGLLVGSCLEPIGPEHSYEEIADLLDLMRTLNISWMATMKRIPICGSPLEPYGQISDEEFARITAVTRLFFGNTIFTLAAHEPSPLCLRAGANFLVAERGTNPRDMDTRTETGRAWDAPSCRAMLKEAGYDVYTGQVNRRYLAMGFKNRFFGHAGRLMRNYLRP
ncbi:radical SAM protein [Desulfoluna butyratoxydans]|uniref:Biotin and thiamin synthesis-associated domain n=1 Tax=Desulfoluna butyratoxydans TaxID=231438 RepID=A0A4U8YSC2_9BACT|nr:radical SAM protein [Desulfoluna butyratoxydans]VFQ44183.1 biotin and thiamin synthesis-associated domain [Desulfoluna butyratoxydans]